MSFICLRDLYRKMEHTPIIAKEITNTRSIFNKLSNIACSVIKAIPKAIKYVKMIITEVDAMIRFF